jgi:hypothetical protein
VDAPDLFDASIAGRQNVLEFSVAAQEIGDRLNAAW